MAPYTNIPLSPAELSYLHTSLSQEPPIRPDGRTPAQFRPLVAEAEILPTANGSARICFADGTEAVVGVKAEVEKSRSRGGLVGSGEEVEDMNMVDDEENGAAKGKGEQGWLDVSIEIPGMRDDDALPVFLAAMLTEALLADGGLQDRLWMNSRFHWRLYVDVCAIPIPPHPLHDRIRTHLLTVSLFHFSRSSYSLSRFPTHYPCSPSPRISHCSPLVSRPWFPRRTKILSSTTTGKPPPTSFSEIHGPTNPNPDRPSPSWS